MKVKCEKENSLILIFFTLIVSTSHPCCIQLLVISLEIRREFSSLTFINKHCFYRFWRLYTFYIPMTNITSESCNAKNIFYRPLVARFTFFFLSFTRFHTVVKWWWWWKMLNFFSFSLCTRISFSFILFSPIKIYCCEKKY